MIKSTSLAESIWDAVVVGAGPAGAASAALLADRGWRVLLVEKSKWPRAKACGGCVNADAIATLRRMKLHAVLRGAAETKKIAILHARGSLTVDASGVAIDRAEFDRRLVELAIERGVEFLSATSVSLHAGPSDFRSLILRHGDDVSEIRTRVVLACDGINGTLLKDEAWAGWSVAKNAWLGVSCTLSADDMTIGANSVSMNIGNRGYVGLVHQSDGRIHLGAALDPIHCRQGGGPTQVIRSILREHGFELPTDVAVQGTGLLTRQRAKIGGHRVLCVGDACGYVEPFTGEGIAWALASAEAVVSLLPEDLSWWPAEVATRWKKLHRRTVGRRQMICRAVRFAVRRPRLWQLAIRLANAAPALIDWIAPRPTPTFAGDLHD